MAQIDKGPHGCNVRASVELANWVHDNSLIGKAERQARLRKALGVRGFLLSERPDGGFFISRWDRLTDARDLKAVELFLSRVGGAT